MKTRLTRGHGKKMRRWDNISNKDKGSNRVLPRLEAAKDKIKFPFVQNATNHIVVSVRLELTVATRVARRATTRHNAPTNSRARQSGPLMPSPCKQFKGNTSHANNSHTSSNTNTSTNSANSNRGGSNHCRSRREPLLSPKTSPKKTKETWQVWASLKVFP
jgi:hypothetical protein